MSKFHIPPPKVWEDFENLCWSIWAEKWEDNQASLHGRKGQTQQGVDVYGTDYTNGKVLSGIQCKAKDPNLREPAKTITAKEIEEEVEKAKNFSSGQLKHFTIVTTGPRDTNAQEAQRQIDLTHQKNGLFGVSVKFWDDIERDLIRYPHVFRFHYLELFNAFEEANKNTNPKKYIRVHLANIIININKLVPILGDNGEMLLSSCWDKITTQVPERYIDQIDGELAYLINEVERNLETQNPFNKFAAPLDRDLEARKYNLIKAKKEITTILSKI